MFLAMRPKTMRIFADDNTHEDGSEAKILGLRGEPDGDIQYIKGMSLG